MTELAFRPELLRESEQVEVHLRWRPGQPAQTRAGVVARNNQPR